MLISVLGLVAYTFAFGFQNSTISAGDSVVCQYRRVECVAIVQGLNLKKQWCMASGHVAFAN